MKTERNLINISSVMFALNFSILAFYSLICATTTYRICESLGAHEFLNTVRQVPQHPWRMPVQSLSLYALLCGVSSFKRFRPVERFHFRVTIFAVEVALCVGIIASVNFYYNGVALLVLADLVHYIRSNKMRLCIIVILSLMFAFGRYDIMAQFTNGIPFGAYLDFYNPMTQSWFTGLESLMVCLNILLFVLYMILLFTSQKDENERIRKLNEQLNQANDQLRDYAINIERMTQMRERNRLAREIHGVLSPNDGIARAIITSCEQAGQEIPAISGLDAENESFEWVWAGRQYSTVAKPTDALVAQTIEIIKSLQAGNGMPATDVKVNNGKIDVLVYELPPVVVTKDNAKEVFANDPGRLELLK